MRPRHALSSAALIAAVLAPGLAAAGPPGWTDPPAKAAAPDTPKPEAPKSPAPAKPAAATASPSSAAASREDTAATRPVAVAKPAVTKPAATTPAADKAAAAKPAATPAPAAARAPEAIAEAHPARSEARRHRTVRAPRFSAPRETFAQVAPDSDARVADWAGTARRLAAAYLDSLSAPNEVTIAAAPRFYADRIQFHGRTMSLSALMQEKRRFTQRWPERRYVPEAQAMRTACDAETATCTVRTPLAFSASNRARGVRSTGVAELVMTVSFAGGRPVIVAESSRVLRRGGATFGALPASATGA